MPKVGRIQRLKPSVVNFRHVGVNYACDADTEYFVKSGTLALDGPAYELYKTWTEASDGAITDVLQQENDIIVIYSPISSRSDWLCEPRDSRCKYNSDFNVILAVDHYIEDDDDDEPPKKRQKLREVREAVCPSIKTASQLLREKVAAGTIIID